MKSVSKEVWKLFSSQKEQGMNWIKSRAFFGSSVTAKQESFKPFLSSLRGLKVSIFLKKPEQVHVKVRLRLEFSSPSTLTSTIATSSPEISNSFNRQRLPLISLLRKGLDYIGSPQWIA